MESIKMRAMLAAMSGLMASGGAAAQCGREWLGDLGTPGIQGDRVVAMRAFHGDLVVVGEFDSVGGVAAKNIAAWDGSRWRGIGDLALTNWWQERCAMQEYRDELVVAGEFDQVGGVPVSRIARWDGAEWHALGSGLGPAVTGGPGEWSMARYQDDLVVSGSFDLAGGVPVTRVARWNGETWSAMGVPPQPGFPSNAMLEVGGVLYAGNWWITAGALRWDDASSTWEVITNGIPPGATQMFYGLFHMGEYQGSLVAIARYCGLSCSHYSFRWNGATWEPLGVPSGVPGKAFTIYRGEPVAGLSGVVRFDGAAWTPMGGKEPTGVLTLAEYKGDLIAGGFFKSLNGQPVGGLARWACACPADCTDNGVLDIDDFICFQTLFAIGAPDADCDGDGQLLIDDFLCFQMRYAIAC